LKQRYEGVLKLGSPGVLELEALLQRSSTPTLQHSDIPTPSLPNLPLAICPRKR